MVELADLARWTPVALHLDPPAIDWCDLSGEPFAEPFLDQTVERWVAAGRALVRTGLDALLALDEAPSLDPCGIVMHCSRCGSTLVSRLLATLPGTVVAAEPAPVNALLQADPARVDRAVQVRVLRLLARALGRVRLGSERRFVLKLSSWNVCRLDLVREAFPAAPLLWVQRAPQQVMASLLAEPPGWLCQPSVAARLFGIPAGDATVLDRTGLCARAVEAMLAAAAESPATVIDYRDLPEAVWEIAAPLFGLEPRGEEIDRMRREAKFSAKVPGTVPFAERSRGAADGIAATAERLQPIYARLDARRTRGEAACSSSRSASD